MTLNFFMSLYIIMDLINPTSFKDSFSKFVVENGVAGVMELEFSNAFPTIGFPFVAAIGEHDASNAIA